MHPVDTIIQSSHLLRHVNIRSLYSGASFSWLWFTNQPCHPSCRMLELDTKQSRKCWNSNVAEFHRPSLATHSCSCPSTDPTLNAMWIWNKIVESRASFRNSIFIEFSLVPESNINPVNIKPHYGQLVFWCHLAWNSPVVTNQILSLRKGLAVSKHSVTSPNSPYCWSKNKK